MKKLQAFVFLVTVLVATSGNAQQECTAILNDTDRLNCYDMAFASTDEQEQDDTDDAGSDAVDIGKWSKSVDVSALTDEKNVFLTLASENEIPGRYRGTDTGRLWFRCMENTTAVLFQFNDHFMSDIQGYGEVEYRLDELPLASISTATSTDNTTLGLWRGSSAIPFIKRVLGHEQLIVRATPFSESPKTLTFDIRGIDNAIIELRETCNW